MSEIFSGQTSRFRSSWSMSRETGPAYAKACSPTLCAKPGTDRQTVQFLKDGKVKLIRQKMSRYKPKFHLARHDTTRYIYSILAQEDLLCTSSLFASDHVERHVERVEVCRRPSFSNSLVSALLLLAFYIPGVHCTPRAQNTKLVQSRLCSPCWNKLGTLRLVSSRHDTTGQVVSCRVEPSGIWA